MAIMQAVKEWRKTEGLSQSEVARKLHIDQSYQSRLERGMTFPEHLDSSAAKMNWRIALAIIDERTSGWIKNRFGELDPHPSAVKEQFTKEMREAFTALEEIMLSDWKDRDKQRENARNVQKEIKDVVEVGLILVGVIGEVFELDKPKKYGGDKK